MKLEKIKKRLFYSVKVTVLCNGVIRKRLNFAVQSSISWDEWRAGFANPSGLSRVIADSLPSPWKGEPIVRTSCLINHWCFLWRRLRAWVTVKGQCELDATYIQVWDLFFFFQCRLSRGWHIAPRYPSSLAFPLYLCHHTSNPPPPQKKKKSPSSLCSSAADPHRCSRAPVETAMRRCYGWGIDKYWKEDDLLSWQPRCTLECSITRRAKAVPAAPQGNADELRCSPPCCTLTKEMQRPHQK